MVKPKLGTASVAALRSIATQDHYEHADAVFKAGAVKPLVELLRTGTSDAQGDAAGALAAIASKAASPPAPPEKHQIAIVNAGGVEPLVALLRTGSAGVQQEAATALAALESDVSHQVGIIKAGAIAPLYEPDATFVPSSLKVYVPTSTGKHASVVVHRSGTSASATAGSP